MLLRLSDRRRAHYRGRRSVVRILPSRRRLPGQMGARPIDRNPRRDTVLPSSIEGKLPSTLYRSQLGHEKARSPSAALSRTILTLGRKRMGDRENFSVLGDPEPRALSPCRLPVPFPSDPRFRDLSSATRIGGSDGSSAAAFRAARPLRQGPRRSTHDPSPSPAGMYAGMPGTSIMITAA